MQYMKNKKLGGSVTAIIHIHTSKGDECNVILDFNIEKLRVRIGNFILKNIKKIRPEGSIIGWKTSIGDFYIYKEFSYDDWDIWKSKYRYIKTVLEFKPKKGEIMHKLLSKTRSINPECELFDECPNCNKKTLLDYEIVRHGEKLKVCLKCKKFDKLLEKIERKLEKEQEISDHNE